MSTTIGASRFAERLGRTQEALAREGVTALLVGVGPDLEWLVGYAAVGHERLNLLVIGPSGPATFIGPRLELAAAEQAPGLGSGAVRLQTWAETEDPYRLLVPLLGTTRAADGRSGPRLLVSDGLRAAFLLGLQRALGAGLSGVSWELASAVLAPLRRVKDAEETALLAAAAEAADRTMAAIARGPLLGRSEAEVAREVRDRLVDEGHDTAEFAIVASGPNSASPHHEPGPRIISPGEPLLLDIGGRWAGYCSDTTRTYWIADRAGRAPDDGFVEIHQLTERAQAAGRAAVRPGASFGSIDAAAREVIAAGGYGEHFFHRLGHGIGLEVHEEPWVIGGNREPAVAGNTFSVEPGIYLEGRHGVRIEDTVLCTPEGCRSLNQSPRGLIVVEG
jgi:Xaa-Pro aminopeptidase